jgi:hypothetical protein
MTTIMPESEILQKAIKWISSNLEDNQNQPLQKLIDQAVFKFDLSPKDADFINKFFHESQQKK